MKTKKVKSFTYFSGSPIDIYNDLVDILVTLEDDDDSKYFFEVLTPKFLSSAMDEKKQKFMEPLYPFIIVQELTDTVIKEAIEAFLNEGKNEFWFKLYYSACYLTIDDLNFIINRNKKEIEARAAKLDEEED